MATFHFDPTANLIRVTATISGQTITRVSLAIDTGSSMTVLSRDAAFDVGLDPDNATQQATVTTLSRAETVPLFTLARMNVRGHSTDNLGILCKDLPLPLQMQVDGLLGLNFLRHFKLFINFPKGVLVLQEKNPRHCLHWLSQILEIAQAHR
ncbi:MAG: retropepsin-like domain-containing protein [Armatimonadetes bacterium]|nr:retropepsin-like domain-containing protein [Armatimonadota bacterium]